MIRINRIAALTAVFAIALVLENTAEAQLVRRITSRVQSIRATFAVPNFDADRWGALYPRQPIGHAVTATGPNGYTYEPVYEPEPAPYRANGYPSDANRPTPYRQYGGVSAPRNDSYAPDNERQPWRYDPRIGPGQSTVYSNGMGSTAPPSYAPSSTPQAVEELPPPRSQPKSSGPRLF